MSSTVSKTGQQENTQKHQVVVVLEGACLETVKSKKVITMNSFSYVGICSPQCGRSQGIHKKLGRDASESRPDICHQVPFELADNECLLSLLDSPLNKAGMLKVGRAGEE